MKTPRGAVLAAGMVAVLALTGCASRGSVRQLQGEVAGLREQVAELRKAQDASTRELAKTGGAVKGPGRPPPPPAAAPARSPAPQPPPPAPPREKRMEAGPAEAEQPAARSGPAE